MFFSRIKPRARSGSPVAITPGSVTTSTRFKPSATRSSPISSVTPGPNLYGVERMVKTLSFIELRSFFVVAGFSRVCSSENTTLCETRTRAEARGYKQSVHLTPREVYM